MRSAGARRRAFWWGRAAATFARRENRAGAPRKSARQIARDHPILFSLWAFGSPPLSFFLGGVGWARRRIWSCVPENTKSNRINVRTPEVHLGGGLPRKAPPSNEALRLKKKKTWPRAVRAERRSRARRARAPRRLTRPRTTNPQARQGQPQTDARTSQTTASQRRPLSVGRSVGPTPHPFDRPPGHATPHAQPAAQESMTWANLPASPTSRSERAHRRDVRRPAGAGLAVGRWWQREAGCGPRRQLGRSAVCTSPHVLRDRQACRMHTRSD